MPHSPVPQRIASLLASATEMLYGLGLGDRVVAVSHECDYPLPALTRPRATVSHVAAPTSGEIDAQVRQLLAAGQPLYSIDGDLLAALAPDLIVTQAQCDVCAVKFADVVELVARRPELAGAEIVALNPMTLEEIFTDIARLGKAASAVDAAAEYIARLRARVTAVRHACADREPVRVAAIEWLDPLMLAGNWMPGLIDLAGGIQPLPQGGVHSTYNSGDEIVAFDPQMILVMPCGFDLARTVAESALLSRMPGWHQLSAVRHQRVFAVDGNAYFNRSGPRIVDSLELLASLLHPEAFPEPAPVVEGLAVWQRLA